jgi:uncharacterized UBP type Zn finger protein
MSDACTHLDQIDDPAPHPVEGCEECLATWGRRWVHLRRCLACGHVGCCDNSPGQHATAHHRQTGHPLIQSYEPGEDWIWCYVDEVAVEIDAMRGSPSHP